MCARRFCIFVALIFLATECQSRRFPVFWPVPIPTTPTKPRPDRPILPDITEGSDEITPLNNEQDTVIKLPVSAKAIDKMINSVKREMHIPGYQFCGPGTKLDERLARGEKGVNKLDAACLKHDMAYRSKDLYVRHEADKVLLAEAQARVNANDAGKMEKLAAYFVVEGMKIKSSGSVFELNAFMKRMQTLFSKMKGTYVDRRNNFENNSYDDTSSDNTGWFGNMKIR